jgi:hypothetical protein
MRYTSERSAINAAKRLTRETGETHGARGYVIKNRLVFEIVNTQCFAE